MMFLPEYVFYLQNNPGTFLINILGLFRVKKMEVHGIYSDSFYLITKNILPIHKNVNALYDLKGSTFGRKFKPRKDSYNKEIIVLKDLDFYRKLYFSGKKQVILEQITKDTNFLKSLGIIDYSLLLGIHVIKDDQKLNLKESQSRIKNENETNKKKNEKKKTVNEKPNYENKEGYLSKEYVSNEQNIYQIININPKTFNGNNLQIESCYLDPLYLNEKQKQKITLPWVKRNKLNNEKHVVERKKPPPIPNHYNRPTIIKKIIPPPIPEHVRRKIMQNKMKFRRKTKNRGNKFFKRFSRTFNNLFFNEPKEKKKTPKKEGLSNRNENEGFLSKEEGRIEEIYMGIIDITQYFNLKKRAGVFAHTIIGHKKEEISSIDEVQYQERFMKFISSVLK